MSFPISPSNGQTTVLNNISYTFDSGTNSWTRNRALLNTLGNLTISNTTVSTSTTTGALIVAGGAGIGGNLYIANTGDVSANIGAYHTYANANVAAIQANIGSFYNYANTKIGTNSNSNLVVVATTQSTSTTTGALVVGGGVGIASNLTVGANVTVTGSVLPSANVTYNLGSYTQRWKDLYLSGSSIILGGATISSPTGGVISFDSGNVVTGSGTASSSTTTGALVVVGGIGVGGSIYQSGSHIPSANVTYNIGSTTAYWGTTYTGGLSANTATFGGGNVTVGYTTATTTSASSNFAVAGNVSIGTSSPTRKLDVYSTTQRGQIAMSGSNVVAIRWNTTDPNPGERNWEIVNNIDQQGTLSIRAGATQNADPTTTRMVIDSGGNVGIGYTASPTTTTATSNFTVAGSVGIGTNTPFGQLNVSGAGQTVSTISTAATAALGGTLYVRDSGGGGGNGGIVLFGASQGSFAAIKGFLTDNANNSRGDLVFSSRNANTDTALTERMRILSDGTLLLRGGSIPTISAYDAPFIFRIAGGGLGLGGSYETGGTSPIVFYTQGTERMRIAYDGNVAIGTSTSTAANLTVQGTGTGTGQAVDGAPIALFNDGQPRGVVSIRGGVDSTALGTNGVLNVGGGANRTYSLTTTHGVLLASTGTTGVNVVVAGTTTSTSTTTGALVVKGGIGVNGNVYLPNNTGIVSSAAFVTNTYNIDPGGVNIAASFGQGSVSSGTGIIAWNRSAGSGEMSFIQNKGGGSVGGFNFYNWANTAVNTTTNVFDISGTGAVTAYGSISPNANVTYNLGSSTAYWGTTFTGGLKANTATFGGGNVTIGYTAVTTTTASSNFAVSGQVGIGNNVPVYKLDVGPVSSSQSATVGASGLIRNSAGADQSPFTQARIIVYGGTGVDTANWGYFGYGSDGLMKVVYGKTGSSIASLGFGTTSATDGSGAWTERARFDTGGNLLVGYTAAPTTTSAASNFSVAGVVGIGTNSPGRQLEVYSASAVYAKINSATTAQSALQVTNGGGNFYTGIDTSTGGAFGAGGYGRVLYSDGAYPMIFATNSTERMRITSAGGISFGATGTAYGTSGQVLTSTGDAPPTWTTWTTLASPQVTVYTTGSGTYTTPTGARWLHIRAVGGGGGGGPSGAGGGTSGTGGSTTFGTTLITCNGGVGGTDNGGGGAGGAASCGTAAGIAISGGQGGGAPAGAANNFAGGMGGSSAFGGAGGSGGGDNAGSPNVGPGNGIANTGGGGGGAAFVGSYASSGGGAGGYVDAIIASPSATYSYAVGAGGTAAVAGTGTAARAGTTGGSGVIYISAYY